MSGGSKLLKNSLKFGMKRIILSLILIIIVFVPKNVFCKDVITGQVKKNEALNHVVDKNTGAPIKNAKINIPQKHFSTYTEQDGSFQLNTSIDKATIMSVEKEGYRPFSITIDENLMKNPLKLGIEQAKNTDIVIEKELYHLGDNVFSKTSANCSDFRAKSVGASYTKTFSMAPVAHRETAYVILGSVIGLDTKLAKEMKQNAIDTAYSSPAEIYFNGQKIGEIHLNGDNIEIPVPTPLIRPTNQLTVKTGRNLFQRNYTDYDDIEIMNISIETKFKENYGVAHE